MIIDNTSHWINQSEISSYLQDVRKYKALTKEEEIELIKNIKNGCKKSEDLLIYTNLRFVIRMAKQYQNQGLSLSDLISEGNLGLLKAAKKYDYDQTEVRFLSYAVWWVKQTILKSLHENSRVIRLPINVIMDANNARKNTPKNEADENCLDNHIVGIPTMNYLDDSFDDDMCLYDVIEDTSVEMADVLYDNNHNSLFVKLRSVLNNLSDSEQYIIVKYFGLDGEAVTLQDISENLGLTKERVRQIKEKVIKKLRFYSKELFELL